MSIAIHKHTKICHQTYFATVSDVGMVIYLYDGDNVIADIENGVLVRSYCTPGLDSNISTTDHTTPEELTHYYTADERMSVVNLTDDTGVVVNDYAYSAYGDAVDSLTGGSVEQRYTYTGRELSDTTEDYYFRYRWYGAGIGGFASRDPLKYVDGMSVYAGWFAMLVGIDPPGSMVQVLWIDDSNDPEYLDMNTLTRKTHFEDQSADKLKSTFDAVDAMIKVLESTSDTDFDKEKNAGNVTFNEKKFPGSRADYILKLKREKTSTWKTLTSSDKKYDDGKAEWKKMITRSTETYDSSGFYVHGYDADQKKPLKDRRALFDATQKIKHSKFIPEFHKIAKGGKGMFVVSSCYSNKAAKKEYYRFRQGKGKASFAKGRCKVWYKPPKTGYAIGRRGETIWDERGLPSIY